MARRTKAEIRAEKIAKLEERRRKENELLRELKREAAKEEAEAFDAALLDFGKWLASQVSVDSVEGVAALREALSNPDDLNTLRSLIETPSTVADDGDITPEADTSEHVDDEEDEVYSSFNSW